MKSRWQLSQLFCRDTTLCSMYENISLRHFLFLHECLDFDSAQYRAASIEPYHDHHFADAMANLPFVR